ncbi:MAG: DUF429 domain-containing protein [Deltaproteobacteria bacterium]|nr:DUF429 domain-containing protein [Deltaproteobacteria bacterium]
MRGIPQRVIAVDWSGAKRQFRKKIWAAVVGPTGLTTLEDGRSREQVRDWLIEEREKDPNFVVGLDFAFSFPSWFVQSKGCSNAPEFWEYVSREGEAWLTELRRPFFTKGGWNSEAQKAYRATEEALRKEGQRPETVFKLVGATQVGPGSIRGMPILHDLREAGFKIWPFDEPSMPFVVEIYPRLFYPGVTKSSLEDRMNHLEKYSELEDLHRTKATCSDDAFDAAVSALKMFERRNEFARLGQTSGESIHLEGMIWC